jgi:hypothetical protein
MPFGTLAKTMKTIKIKPESFKIGEFSEAVKTHFAHKYKVTTNNVNEIIVAKDKAIGCKIVLTKKKMMVLGFFPTNSRMIIAMLVLILGGIMIPLIVYFIAFKGKFEAMENEVFEYINSEFEDRLI